MPSSSKGRPASRAALAGEVYEAETIRFMREHARAGDVVHAGTYFGDFLPALSAEMAANAKIWAFEPNHESYRCARVTVELNQIRNISLTNAGLGARSGSSTLRTIGEDGTALGGASQILDESAPISVGDTVVEIVAIDDVVPLDRSVSILQLDVEGFELQALEGALATIDRCSPIIILEVVPGSQIMASDWMSENVLALGYRADAELVNENVILRRQ